MCEIDLYNVLCIATVVTLLVFCCLCLNFIITFPSVAAIWQIKITGLKVKVYRLTN